MSQGSTPLNLFFLLLRSRFLGPAPEKESPPLPMSASGVGGRTPPPDYDDSA
jgi:hypothetical protein